MKIIRKIALMMLIVAVSASITSCGRGSAKEKDVFRETDDIIYKYFDAIAAGRSDEIYACEYKYMSDSNEKNDISEPRPRVWIDSVMDYVIKEKEKVNDNLFVYTMLLASSDNLDVYKKIYFFVVRIDSKLYIADVPWSIPDDLKDGFDESNYVYDDPNMNTAPPEDYVKGQ